jgi:hypothetical protein
VLSWSISNALQRFTYMYMMYRMYTCTWCIVCIHVHDVSYVPSGQMISICSRLGHQGAKTEYPLHTSYQQFIYHVYRIVLEVATEGDVGGSKYQYGHGLVLVLYVLFFGVWCGTPPCLLSYRCLTLAFTRFRCSKINSDDMLIQVFIGPGTSSPTCYLQQPYPLSRSE